MARIKDASHGQACSYYQDSLYWITGINDTPSNLLRPACSYVGHIHSDFIAPMSRSPHGGKQDGKFSDLRDRGGYHFNPSIVIVTVWKSGIKSLDLKIYSTKFSKEYKSHEEAGSISVAAQHPPT